MRMDNQREWPAGPAAHWEYDVLLDRSEEHEPFQPDAAGERYHFKTLKKAVAFSKMFIEVSRPKGIYIQPVMVYENDNPDD